MSFHIHVFLLVVGLILLIKGADFFVESASRIAKKLGVSEFIIGLTLVAIGTSIPEISASVIAALNGNSGIVTGNVVGSNIANIGLILGLTAAFTAINIKKTMLKRDGYIMLSTGLLFYILAINGVIGREESILFLFIYVAYSAFLIQSSQAKETYHFEEFLDYFMSFKYLLTIRNLAVNRFKKKDKKTMTQKERKEYYTFKEGLIKNFLIFIISATAIVFGARYLVSESIWFAGEFGVQENIIAISIIALGTSLPELSVTLRAAKKGIGDIVVGNVLGSNIANTLLVVGIAGLVHPIEISKLTLFYTIPFMLFFSMLILLFMRRSWKISKKEGKVLLLLYIGFILSLFVFALFI